jgi:hypothetical protein
MGYQRNKAYLLAFDDPEYEGLEIRARGLSISRAMVAMRLASVFDNDERNFSPEELKKLDTLIRMFAGCPDGCPQVHEELIEQGGGHYTSRILSWNLEDESGAALEPDYVTFTDQDADFTMSVVMAWLQGVLSTPAPLDGNSNDGKPPEVVSIPMETLSPALLS